MFWEVNDTPFKEVVPSGTVGEVVFMALRSQSLVIGTHVLEQFPKGEGLERISYLHGTARTMHVHLLEENFHSYTLHTRGFSPDTVRRNRNALRLFFKHCDIVEIEQATADVVRRWVFEGRTLRNWSP